MKRFLRKVGSVFAKAPQGSGAKQQEVARLRDVTDRVRAMKDKYFKRPAGKR